MQNRTHDKWYTFKNWNLNECSALHCRKKLPPPQKKKIYSRPNLTPLLNFPVFPWSSLAKRGMMILFAVSWNEDADRRLGEGDERLPFRSDETDRSREVERSRDAERFRDDLSREKERLRVELSTLPSALLTSVFDSAIYTKVTILFTQYSTVKIFHPYMRITTTNFSDKRVLKSI